MGRCIWNISINTTFCGNHTSMSPKNEMKPHKNEKKKKLNGTKQEKGLLAFEKKTCYDWLMDGRTKGQTDKRHGVLLFAFYTVANTNSEWVCVLNCAELWKESGMTHTYTHRCISILVYTIPIGQGVVLWCANKSPYATWELKWCFKCVLTHTASQTRKIALKRSCAINTSWYMNDAFVTAMCVTLSF